MGGARRRLKVTVEASASSANLGPGFDVFALALDKPRDRIGITTEKATRLSVHMKRVDGIKTPLTVSRNSAGAVCLAIATDFKVMARISLELSKGVPIGHGLGSSGASAAATAFGMNELFRLGMNWGDMIYYAGIGEKMTSGTAHYDNVSASMLGGFIVVRVVAERPLAVRYDAPEDIALCIATPAVDLPARKTEYARSVLPSHVPLGVMVSNVANASLIVSGFAKGNIQMIGAGMNDQVVEAARKKFIPGYDAVRKAGFDTGAAGVCISGAGPSMLAVVDGGACKPQEVLRGMIEGFRSEGIESHGFVTVPGRGVVRV
jgi:homoserine kinase